MRMFLLSYEGFVGDLSFLFTTVHRRDVTVPFLEVRLLFKTGIIYCISMYDSTRFLGIFLFSRIAQTRILHLSFISTFFWTIAHVSQLRKLINRAYPSWSYSCLLNARGFFQSRTRGLIFLDTYKSLLDVVIIMCRLWRSRAAMPYMSQNILRSRCFEKNTVCSSEAGLITCYL